jgi:chromosome segregation ATPase
VLLACVLVALGGGAVLAAALSGSLTLAVVAGVAATALGGAAVRITYAEVVDSRRDAGRDRAEQAQAYRVLAEERSAEQAIYVADTSGRIARHEANITRLEARLADAGAELDRARADLASAHDAARRLTADRDRLSRGRDDAEERAAMAIVRVAELEQELDLVLTEWRAGQSAPRRKHA